MELRSEGDELLGSPTRLPPALGIALLKKWCDELKDAIGLALRCEPVAPQVSRLESATKHLCRDPRDTKVRTVVGFCAVEYPMRVERIEVLWAETAGVCEFTAVEDDVGQQRRPFVRARVRPGGRPLHNIGRSGKTSIESRKFLADDP